MNILEIIAKKRDKQTLSKEEIEYFIKGYTEGSIEDYQAAAFIMAVYINGMTKEETADFTLAMAHSGDVLDLSILGENIVDKHSTGGVGDKVSLILLPVVAALGVPVAKMAGRGLGITGGTLDKLEAIPGYQVQLSEKAFIEKVKENGISLIGQTKNLAPADQKIYALRDTIACTNSFPLIASSVMSKKIASGANKILLEVTCGKGAFMKTLKQATRLAEEMIQIGKLAGKETICVLTSMEEPLGCAVGNSLEVIEAVEALRNKMPKDLQEVVLELGSYMIFLAGKGDLIEENKQRIIEVIENGKAYEKFLTLVKSQGGDVSYLEDTSKIKAAKWIMPVVSDKTGFVKQLDAEKVGYVVRDLGAGRIEKEDKIDLSVGVVLKKKIGDHIQKGEVLAYVHSNDQEKGEVAIQELKQAYEIVQEVVEKPKTILGVVS